MRLGRYGIVLGAACTALVAGACVSNPGEYVLTVLPESRVAFKTTSGAPTFDVTLGSAACSDGVDNDLDGETDFVDDNLDDLPDPGSDTACSGFDDNNERLDAAQSYEEPTAAIQIDAAGNVTLPDSELIVVPEKEECIATGSGIQCLLLSVETTSATAIGSVDLATHAIHLEVSNLLVRVRAAAGFPGLGDDCSVGPLGGTLVADSYSTETGSTTFAAADVPVPGASGCGPYESLFNSALGLPGLADVTVYATIMTATDEGESLPIAFDS